MNNLDLRFYRAYIDGPLADDDPLLGQVMDAVRTIDEQGGSQRNGTAYVSKAAIADVVELAWDDSKLHDALTTLVTQERLKLAQGAGVMLPDSKLPEFPPVSKRFLGERAVNKALYGHASGDDVPAPKTHLCECACSCGRDVRQTRHTLCWPCYADIRDHGEEGHLERAQQDAAMAIAEATHCEYCGGTLVVDQHDMVVCAACQEPQAVAR